MPTPSEVMLNAVSVTIMAAVTSPYSAGTRKRASRNVPTMPTTREARLVDSVQAAPRTVRAVRLDGAVGDSVIDCGVRCARPPLPLYHRPGIAGGAAAPQRDLTRPKPVARAVAARR